MTSAPGLQLALLPRDLSEAMSIGNDSAATIITASNLIIAKTLVSAEGVRQHFKSLLNARRAILLLKRRSVPDF